MTDHHATRIDYWKDWFVDKGVIEEGSKADEIKDLAALLAEIHVRRSVPSWMRASLGIESLSPWRDLRAVAIVGAGASLPVTKVARDLAVEFIAKHETDPDAYRSELQRLEFLNEGWIVDDTGSTESGDNEDFETSLAAFSRTAYNERRAREQLSKLHLVRHPALLRYDILAHLLKHRILDAIISFNFDELLDQSLIDELGPDEYVPIISERDLVRVRGYPGDADYVPLYYKLHGTASDPDSLKFTRQDYYRLPDAIAESVRKLLGHGHCVLVNVGFGMQSLEFTQLLSIPTSLSIFSFTKDKLSSKAVRALKKVRGVAHGTDEVRQGEPYRLVAFDDGDKANSVDRFEAKSGSPFHRLDLQMLWLADAIDDVCQKHFNGIAAVRSVVRHQIAAEVLGMPMLNNPDDPTRDNAAKDYLTGRLALEMAFSNVRSRGLITIEGLNVDRAGPYFDLLTARLARTGNHLEGLTWEKACAMAGLVESTHATGTYVAKRDLVMDSSKFEGVTQGDPLVQVDPSKLAQLTMTFLAASGATRSAREHLEDAYHRMGTSTEVEVHSGDDKICRRVFSRPETLVTLTALQARTHLLLRDESIRRVDIEAETGEWLLTDPILELLRGKRIRLLVAFCLSESVFEDAYGDLIERRWVPWWRHNRHMTVGHDDHGPKAAIYFARRQRTLAVTPVYLEDRTDAYKVQLDFERLWKETDRWDENETAELPSGVIS